MLFSNPTAVLEWVTTNEAKVKVKVPPSPNVMTFYMFVYEDENRIRLLGLYRIVINSQLGYFNLTQNRYKLYYGSVFATETAD